MPSAIRTELDKETKYVCERRDQFKSISIIFIQLSAPIFSKSAFKFSRNVLCNGKTEFDRLVTVKEFENELNQLLKRKDIVCTKVITKEVI